MSITLENGRINLDFLVTIEDHLRGLALANRTLDSIKEQLAKHSDKKSDWHRRATVAHKSWFWARPESASSWLIYGARKKTLTAFAGSTKTKPCLRN